MASTALPKKEPNSFDRVHAIVKKIPKGKVASYGNIAKKAGFKNPQIVVWAIHNNKDSKKLPCHRIVKVDGSLASGYGMGGPEVQRAMLEQEGIVFNKDGKIDLEQFGWQ